MKLKGYSVPNALALTTAIVFVVCRVLVGLFPDAMYAVAQSWFHGIGWNRTELTSLTSESFILGLISSAVSAWIVGYVFVTVQKALTK